MTESHLLLLNIFIVCIPLC